MIREWWRHAPFAVLLATGVVFDGIDLPAGPAARVRAAAPTGPLLATPEGRWIFLVHPGHPLRPDLAAHPDAVLHAGGSWLPAPPTPQPAGRGYWVTSPDEVGWRLPDSYAVQAAALAALAAPTRAVTRLSAEPRRPAA